MEDDEIKEILEDLKDEDCYWLDCGRKNTSLSYEEAHLLLDYITNLQDKVKPYETGYLYGVHDERERNKAELTNLQHTKEYLGEVLYEQDLELQDYKSRIEKAVEYIEKEKSNYMRSCDISNATNREGLIISSAVRTCDDALNILNGKE